MDTTILYNFPITSRFYFHGNMVQDNEKSADQFTKCLQSESLQKIAKYQHHLRLELQNEN